MGRKKTISGSIPPRNDILKTKTNKQIETLKCLEFSQEARLAQQWATCISKTPSLHAKVILICHHAEFLMKTLRTEFRTSLFQTSTLLYWSRYLPSPLEKFSLLFFNNFCWLNIFFTDFIHTWYVLIIFFFPFLSPLFSMGTFVRRSPFPRFMNLGLVFFYPWSITRDICVATVLELTIGTRKVINACMIEGHQGCYFSCPGNFC